MVWTSSSSCCSLWEPSGTYFFNMETLNIGCTTDILGGCASSKATSLTYQSTSHGQIYHVLSLPHLPKRTLSLVKETFRKTRTWGVKLMSLHCWSSMPSTCPEWIIVFVESTQQSFRIFEATLAPLLMTHHPQTNKSMICRPAMQCPQNVIPIPA